MQFIYKKILRKFFFLLEPELAHKVALNLLNLSSKLNISNFLFSSQSLAKISSLEDNNIFGIVFKNKIGIAAGLDKNAEYIDGLASLGVGFIEVGTVTPKAQQGNPKPRLFRLVKNNAIINRMGFNNKGVLNLIDNIKSSKLYSNKQSKLFAKSQLPVLGINIGKNFDTPNEAAIFDYIYCLEQVYPFADYITINISSPNTKNLRELQKPEYLQEFLSKIKSKHDELVIKYNQYKPLALKIAPDLSNEEINNICQLLYINKIDIVIISNTTNDSELLYDKDKNKIQGGLSGQPLFEKSNNILAKFKKCLLEYKRNTNNINYTHNIYIIGVGGIFSSIDALKKIELGADLIQVYTGLIYEGPGLIQNILKEL